MEGAEGALEKISWISLDWFSKGRDQPVELVVYRQESLNLPSMHVDTTIHRYYPYVKPELPICQIRNHSLDVYCPTSRRGRSGGRLDLLTLRATKMRCLHGEFPFRKSGQSQVGSC